MEPIESSIFMPSVTGPGGRPLDLPSSLFAEGRIIFLNGAVNDDSAYAIVAALLKLEEMDKKKPIWLYINSPGGSVYDGLGILGVMETIAPPVHTVVTGLAASMGAFLLGAGLKGKRYALPYARIMIHQPSGGSKGQATDIKIQADEILYLRQLLNGKLAEWTGQPLSKIEQDTERDFFLSPEEAVAYGLIDEVIRRAPEA